jgi:hypothetical protein
VQHVEPVKPEIQVMNRELTVEEVINPIIEHLLGNVEETTKSKKKKKGRKH